MTESLKGTEATSLLAANGTYNGSTIDTDTAGQGGPGWSKFRALVYSDQAGTLNMQQSRDGTTWRTTISQAYNASTGTIVESLITRRYVRASVTNGSGGTQTVFELDTCLVEV